MTEGHIIIDGVIFQLQRNSKAGISRVWYHYLEQLSQMPLARRIIILDREKSAPRFPQFSYVDAMPLNIELMDMDPLYLKEAVSGLNASLFISTYFTFPEQVPTLLLLHDMTPEMLGLDFTNPEWILKLRALEQADGFIAISENTRDDFHKLYPHLAEKPITVIPNAVSDTFRPHSEREIELFKRSFELTKPYYLYVGARYTYKNLTMLLKAFSLLEDKDDYELLLAGGIEFLEEQYLPYIERNSVRIIHPTDEQLSAAYAGAEAFVYPSLYEGFGLPLIEAMKSGCPVITLQNSALPEVAGDAALYTENHNIRGLKELLIKVRDKEIRKELIDKGFERQKQFSWEQSGKKMNDFLISMLDQVAWMTNKPPLPVNSGVRFFYSLSNNSETAKLASELFQTVKFMKAAKESFDFANIENIENNIVSLFTDELFQQLEKTVQNDFHDELLNYWYGVLLEARGKESEALAQFMLFLRKSGTNARVAMKALQLAQRLERYVTAYTLLSNLLKINPHNDALKLAYNEVRELQLKLRDNVTVQTIAVPPLKESVSGESYADEKISIILPTKGRSEGAREFLDSLPAAANGVPYEILLYFGGANKEEAQLLKDEYPVTEIIFDEELFGKEESFSWARVMNDGFGRASGTLLMFGSDDIILYPNAFPFALAQLKHNTNAGAVTFLYRNSMQDYGKVFSTFGYDTAGGYPYINFGLIKKTAFDKTGGFDEQFRFYWADVDISTQLHEKGYDIAVSEYSLVEHVNIIDIAREKNSGDRYILDTNTFYEKWNEHILFKGKRCLDKIRYAVSGDQEKRLLAGAGGKISSADTKEKGQSDKESRNIDADESAILLSAIVSTYDSEQFMEGCLEDLINQTLYTEGKLEIIIVDSASPGGEGEIVKEYMEKHPHIRYTRTKDRITIYEAWNTGIQMASGEFITNANTDDRHKNDAYEVMLAEFENHPETDVLYADVLQTETPNDTFESASKKSIISWVEFDPDLLLIGCYIGPQPIWRKSLHDRFGLFDGSLKVVGDYEFWLRISRSAAFRHLKQPLGLYFSSGESLEHRDERQTQFENILTQKKYFEKYVKSRGDVKRIEKLLDTVYRARKDKQYDLYARQLLQRRALVFDLRDNIDILLETKALGIGDKYLQTVDSLLRALESGELFLTEKPYITVLLLMKAFYLRQQKRNDEAEQMFEEAEKHMEIQRPSTLKEIAALYHELCPH